MNKRFARILRELPLLALMMVLAAVLVLGLQFDRPPNETAKQYCLDHGKTETGAINLVTAIYLEYRAFDTLGETIVLMLSIAGVIFLVERHHA